MKEGRVLLASCALLMLFICIVTIFWQMQLRYLQPTPLPKGHQQVPVNSPVASHLPGVELRGRLSLLHFFNPDCPCSKFNLQHFESLLSRYNEEVDFYVVVQTDKSNYKADAALKASQAVILNDHDGSIADRCGVFATPQAVILDAEGRIIYRGNYNKARYCTSKDSWFAQQVLDARLGRSEETLLEASATIPYGCNLPSDKDALDDAVRSLFAVIESKIP
ncbi:MAG: DUF6436 domain-containing protein [Cyclobacteriaceae bacterium]